MIDSDQEDLFEHYKFQADPGQELIRIDKFLGERLANTSVSYTHLTLPTTPYV